VEELFNRIAKATARATGHPIAFVLALTVIIVWAVSGPIFGFSDTWQLVINTGTTIATFLMVFLIQNTQNRDAAAVQIKFDELVRAVGGAQDGMLDLEELTEPELEKVRSQYEDMARAARDQLRKTGMKTAGPDHPADQADDKDTKE
jgi:low affinity Fe/Cu permease